MLNGLKMELKQLGIQCKHSDHLTSWKDLNGRGTCAMKARDEGGVVDPSLNVYGTQNLKVAGKDQP